MGRKLNLDLIPTCLGTHDPGEKACDGAPDSGGKDAHPCSWRERCIGFKRHLEETGHDDEQYIELVPIKSKVVQERTGWKRTATPVGRTHKEFILFCVSLVRLYGVRKLARPRAHAKPQGKGGTSLCAKKASRGTTSAKPRAYKYSADKSRRKVIRQLIAHFCYTLREMTKRKLKVGARGALVVPGGFYIVDRRETSGYISIYCRRVRRSFGPDATDTAIVALYPRYMTITLDARVAADVRDVTKILSPEDAFNISPEPIADGAFSTVCKRLDTDKLTVLARGIAQLIDQGIIQLPPR